MFGPSCKNHVVVKAEALQLKQCDRMQHDYCQGFAASFLYAQEHPWCHSGDVPGCLDGHRLRTGIKLNLKIQSAATGSLLIPTIACAVAMVAHAKSWTALQPSSFLVLILSLHVVSNLIIAIFMKGMPEVAKRFYLGWCFSPGLPADILVHLHFTLQATVDLAYARLCFAAAGLGAICVQSCWESQTAGVKVLQVILCKIFVWIKGGARGFEHHASCGLFAITGWLKLTECPRMLCALKAAAMTATEETKAATDAAVAAATKVSATLVPAKTMVLSGVLATKLQHFGCIASMLERLCCRPMEAVRVGAMFLCKKATPANIALLFSFIMVMCDCYLQCEDLWQNAVAMDDDFGVIAGSLAGHTLPGGHACVKLNSTLQLAIGQGPLKKGTLAEVLI